jgi:hypothetical protein
VYEGGSPKDKTIRMTDPDIENANAIRVWLDQVTGRVVPMGNEFVDTVRSVMYLARKYDCSAILETVLARAYAAVHMDLVPLQSLLILAAEFECPELVANHFRLTKTTTL